MRREHAGMPTWEKGYLEESRRGNPLAWRADSTGPFREKRVGFVQDWRQTTQGEGVYRQRILGKIQERE